MNPQALIQDYLDDGLNDAQFAELSAWLTQRDANREAFAQAVNLDTDIHRQLANADLHGFLEEVDIHAIQDVLQESHDDSVAAMLSITDAEIERKRVNSLGRTLDVLARAGFQFIGQSAQKHLTGLGIAAAILLATTLIVVFRSNSPNPGPTTPDIVQAPGKTHTPVRAQAVGTLTGQQNATWVDDFDFGTPEIGEALISGRRLTLVQGYAQITTLRDATLLLEGPCTVEMIDSPNAIRLVQGSLAGHVGNERARGLLVRTPHLDITDLGTRFGVVASAAVSGVQVIEGEVEVVALLAKNDVSPTQLFAGQAAFVLQDASQVALTDDLSKRFVHNWQAVVEVPELTGTIRYEPAIPGDLRVGASEANDVRLYHERSAVELKHDTTVTITKPGQYNRIETQQSKVVAGTVVDTYFIHFDPASTTSESTHCRATIRFDRPILGVIARGDHLTDSHADLGLPGIIFDRADLTSGLDISTINPAWNDSLSISQDRLTLTLDLHGMEVLDQVRVLVQSTEASE